MCTIKSKRLLLQNDMMASVMSGFESNSAGNFFFLITEKGLMKF